MSLKKRAYSDEEKQQREQMILDAAQQLLMQKSYHSINMSEIARAANLAKGTVYLYFQTREELFLTLFERQFAHWIDTINQGLKGGNLTKTDVIRIFVETTANNRQLIRLAALSNIIFEYNISYDKALEYKLRLYDSVEHLGAAVERVLGLQERQGAQLLYRLYVFVIGLENIANPAPISREVYANNPTLSHPDFETELTALVTMLIESF